MDPNSGSSTVFGRPSLEGGLSFKSEQYECNNQCSAMQTVVLKMDLHIGGVSTKKEMAMTLIWHPFYDKSKNNSQGFPLAHNFPFSHTIVDLKPFPQALSGNHWLGKLLIWEQN